MSDLFSRVVDDYHDLAHIEIASIACAIAYIVLAARGNIWCWLFGGISSALFAYVLINSRLYSEALLNGYYIAMSFYGRYQWRHRKPSEQSDEPLIVESKPFSFYSWHIGLAAVAALIWGYVMQETTDADYPYPDAFTTVFALYATWLTARRLLENWLFWIVIDFAGCFLFAAKGLYLTTLLYGGYTIAAGLAYYRWQSLYRRQQIS